jgi:predicted glycosyltransferase involved in capsule biosynthesis
VIELRRIDLKNYDVGEGDKKFPYDVKGSMVNALFNPDLRLGFKELFENDRVAQKINSAQDHVLLEEAEYQKLKQAFESFRGYNKEDVELVRRVLEAPETNVIEDASNKT